MLYKRCRVIHKETKKNEFAFLRFLYDFLWIFEVSTVWLKPLRIILAVRSLAEVLLSHICPQFAQNTQERVWILQFSPRERAGGSPAKFRRGRRSWPARRGRRAAWGSPRLDLWARLGRRAVGELTRRSPAATAARARAPAKLRCRQGNKWHG
jgi:hypothetical protein